MSITRLAAGRRLNGYVQNRPQLLSHGAKEQRRIALDVAEAAIASANPAAAVRGVVSADNHRLNVGDREFSLSRSRVFVIGAGKATFAIADALDEILDTRIFQGLIACKRGEPGSLKHIKVHYADHPIPSSASLEAAIETQALLRNVRPGDIVIACFTGGSSSLFVYPADEITLQDKIEANRILLGCGANIVEINAIRKHLSKVKGGRLVRNLAPGVHLINLTVSDVIGDPLDCITDPSVPDSSTLADACATADKYCLWEQFPHSVTRLLRCASADHDTVRAAELKHLNRVDVLLAGPHTACAAAAEAARTTGFTPLILSTAFEGESRELGRFMAGVTKEVVRSGRPLKSPCVLIGGGETTVVMSGKVGQGGPNQEFALSIASELAGCENIAALGIDTDGTDGPTAFAGGIVDGTTAGRAKQCGISIHKALAEHNVSPVLDAVGGLVVTGPTGTNVNDLKLVVIGTGSSVPGP